MSMLYFAINLTIALRRGSGRSSREGGPLIDFGLPIFRYTFGPETVLRSHLLMSQDLVTSLSRISAVLSSLSLSNCCNPFPIGAGGSRLYVVGVWVLVICVRVVFCCILLLFFIYYLVLFYCFHVKCSKGYARATPQPLFYYIDKSGSNNQFFNKVQAVLSMTLLRVGQIY